MTKVQWCICFNSRCTPSINSKNSSPDDTTTTHQNGFVIEPINQNIFTEYTKSSYVKLISMFLSELIGTALLLFFGCMGCINGFNTEFPSSLLRAMTFGMVVMMLVNVFGCISGAHFNPAVTLCAVMCKLITIPVAIMYFIAEFIGAILGFGLLKAVVPDSILDYNSNNSTEPGLCSTSPHAELTTLSVFVIEFMLTAGLLFICCSLWDPQNKNNTDSVPLRVGFAVVALSIAGGPLTGASMNPARTLAPALWNDDFDRHWVYWVSTMSAAIVVPIVYRVLFWKEDLTKNKDAALNVINSC